MKITHQEKEMLLDALIDLAADGFQEELYSGYTNYSDKVLMSLRRKGFIQDFVPYKEFLHVNSEGKDIYQLAYNIIWDLENMKTFYGKRVDKNKR